MGQASTCVTIVRGVHIDKDLMPHGYGHFPPVNFYLFRCVIYRTQGKVFYFIK